MTINEAIKAADDLRKGNLFSTAQKYRWINLCESAIQTEILLMKELTAVYVPGDDEEETLLAPQPYDELYVQWLCAKIDEAQAQYEIYSNTISQYNRTIREFAKWVIKHYDPKHHDVGVRYEVPVIVRGGTAELYIGDLPLYAEECTEGIVTLKQGETVLTFKIAGTDISEGVTYTDNHATISLSAKNTSTDLEAGNAFASWELTDRDLNVLTPDKSMRIKILDPGIGTVLITQER